MKAFQHLTQFRGDATFGTWVHRIAVNLSLNGRRSLTRRARWFAPLEAAEGTSAPPNADPDLSQSLKVAINALTDGQREVFVMHALEGYTHVEIGKILGISEGTSKGRLFHARARLKEMLAPFAPDGVA